MRAIIYTRVSADTAHGRSVTEQENECRTICEREHWDIAHVLCDNGIGASRHSKGIRPEFARLAELAQPGDVLVTWEASRAQRDLGAYVALRELCAERGILWSYSGTTHDLTTGDGRFRTGLDALLSENEAEKTRERVLRAARANAKAGRAHGSVLYGYRAVRDEHTGKIIQRIPHPEQAPIVREIGRRILAGESAYVIVSDLNARNVPTPRTSTQWRASLVVPMLKRRTYAGFRTHHGEEYPGEWEGLFSDTEHRKILAVITNPSRAVPRGTRPVHLLTGIAKCGVCGAPMWRLKSNGGSSLVCGATSRCVSRKMGPIDTMVTELVLQRLESLTGVEDFANDAAAEALQEARDLRARLEGFTDKAADGELSPAVLARIEGKLLPQIKAAERRGMVTVSPLVGELLGVNARARWAVMPIEGRRAVVRSLLEVVVRKGTRGRGFRPELIEVTWK